MKTDKQIYSIFETDPHWLFELTKRRDPGPCRMISIALKALERISDCVVILEAKIQSQLLILSTRFGAAPQKMLEKIHQIQSSGLLDRLMTDAIKVDAIEKINMK